MNNDSTIRKRNIARNSSFSDADDDGTGQSDDQEELSKIVKTKEPISLQKVLTRTVAAIVMCLFYLGILYSGHLYCILLGVITQTELYRELVNVRYVEAKERKMPWFRTLQWAWFFVAMVFVYGETLHKFAMDHRQLYHLTAITQHWGNIVFVMYCSLFVISVLTLKTGLLRFQISQFMWSIVTVCLVVFQCKFFATNTLNGLFWYFFPMATVVCNDVSAYFCGITMGKKFISAPFLPLSPNKTWEGFIGAAFLTIIFSFFFPRLLSQSTWFTCPAETLSLSPFPPALQCTPISIFTDSVSKTLPFVGEVEFLTIQFHGLAYGLFASLVAPFGGFFASAIKRAYRKKDFDSFVPGHGGMMDRMDCQLLMMAFTAFHYRGFVASTPSIARMEFLASLMSPAEQRLLLEKLAALVNDSQTI